LNSSNKIWELIAESVAPTKIRSIDISDNPLIFFPNRIKSLTNLKTIIGSHCGLKSQTIDLSDLSKLQQVDFSSNELEVDSVILFPQSLQKLSLSNNQYSGISSVFLNLVNLAELDLSNNRIERMEGLGTLVSLVIITLDNNLIVEIPYEMCQLAKLVKLSLVNNRINKQAVTFEGQSIPEDFFLQVPIEILDLTGNILTNSEILQFKGVDVFLERKQKIREKGLQGGALSSYSVFGLT
jgi:Leucine-rich repeat (LRR) protein